MARFNRRRLFSPPKNISFLRGHRVPDSLSTSELLSALGRLGQATETQTRVQAWSERARRFEWIGEISDDHVRGARAVLWDHFGQQSDVPERELVRVITVQRIYEYLIFCHEQDELLGKNGLDVDYEEWIRQMLTKDDDLVGAHLVSGVAYPRFAHWFNRVLWSFAQELELEKVAKKRKQGARLQKQARDQAGQIIARGHMRKSLAAKARRLIGDQLEDAETVGERERLLAQEPALIDSLLGEASVFKNRRP